MPRGEKRYAMVWSEEPLKEKFETKPFDAQDAGERVECISSFRSVGVDTKYLKPGIVVGFTAYVVPVVRIDGVEKDAFNLSEFESEEEAYGAWIRDEIGKHGAGVVGKPTLYYHATACMSRQTQTKPREMRTFYRPVAEIGGELQITDRHKLVAGLLRGLGRHRSFGYGMMGLQIS
jgi:hypothetical protein